MRIKSEADYLLKLIEGGENQHLDFKFAINDARKIAKTLVAFANTDGGTLLVGVKDNKAIAGVRTEEEYFMVESAAQLYSKPEIIFTTKRWLIEKKTILEVIVQKSENLPHYAQNTEGKWLSYIRVGDQNLLANSVMLKIWKQQQNPKPVKINYSRNQELLLSFLEEFGTITISKFSKMANLKRFEAEKILVDLILLNIIEIVFTEKSVFYKLKQQ